MRNCPIVSLLILQPYDCLASHFFHLFFLSFPTVMLYMILRFTLSDCVTRTCYSSIYGVYVYGVYVFFFFFSLLSSLSFSIVLLIFYRVFSCIATELELSDYFCVAAVPSECVDFCLQDRQPDASCYALMADAAVEANNKPKAIKYVAETEKRGLQASARAVAFAEGRGDGLEDDAPARLPATTAGAARVSG